MFDCDVVALHKQKLEDKELNVNNKMQKSYLSQCNAVSAHYRSSISVPKTAGNGRVFIITTDQ